MFSVVIFKGWAAALGSSIISSDQAFPSYLKLKKLAQAQAKINGLIDLDRFQRLRSHASVDASTFGQGNQLELNLSFDYDDSGWLVIKGLIHGHLNLVCQRCLESVAWPIDLKLNLAVVSDEELLSQLPESYEPVLSEEAAMTTVDLIEDDLLLSVPLVPAHEVLAQCKVSDVPGLEFQVTDELLPEEDSATNPFSVLKTIKSKDQEN